MPIGENNLKMLREVIAEPPAKQQHALFMVAPYEVNEIWPLAESLLEPELPQIDLTSEQLRDGCARGQMTLWLICDDEDKAVAALVTGLTPAGRCHVLICCGDSLWDYLGCRDQLYAWAKEQGMKEVVFYGRPALAKLMPECKRGVILRKEL